MGLFDRLKYALLGSPFELSDGLTSLGDLNAPVSDVLERRRAAADARLAEARQAETIAIGGGLVLDPDDPIYRRIGGNKLKNRDLMPLQQDRMLEIAWYLWESNPLAKRLITLMTDLIVGEGVTVEAKDQRLQEQIDLAWNHRVNQLHARIREFHNSLALNGELVMPVTRNPVTGRPVFGFIDPYQIQRVDSDPLNILVKTQIVLKPDLFSGKGQTATDGEVLQIINENPETGMLEGNCFYFPINTLPNSLRGRSDFLPIADWLDLYDQFMFAQVERLQFLSAFVWDLKMDGATPDQIKQKVKDFPKSPKPGTAYIHNEKESLDAKTPDLRGTDTSEAMKMLLTHAGGNIGFPTSWLGVTDSNRATIEGQNDVMMKTPSARQKEFKSFLFDVVRYAIEGVTGANPALFRGADPGFDIRMPEIAAKDVARIGTSIQQLISAMDVAVKNETMSRRAVIVVQTAVLKHLGVELVPADLEAEIADEVEERQQKADQRAAQQAAQQQQTGQPGGPTPTPAPEPQPAGAAA